MAKQQKRPLTWQDYKREFDTIRKNLDMVEQAMRRKFGVDDPNADANKQTEQVVTTAKPVDMTAKTTTPDTVTMLIHDAERDKAVLKMASQGYRLAGEQRRTEYYADLTFIRDGSIQTKTVIPNPLRG